MAKGTLTVRIVGDAKSFSNTMRKTSGDVAGFGKKVAKMGLLAGAAAVAGIGLVGTKLVAAGEAASTANARIANITNQMDLFGAGAAKVSDRLVDLSNSQARQTGMSTEAIKESKALLMTFSEVAKSADKAGGVFDRAGAAALDMAAAGFGEASDTAKQLGKALNDPIKGISALSRSGVTFTEVEKERIRTLVESNKMGEAQTLILEAIEKQVGGTANATADASAQLKETWNQAVQQIGLEVLPAFQKVVEWLSKRIPGAVEVVKGWFQKLRDWWSTNGPAITTAIRNVADAVQTYWAGVAKPAIADFAEALRTFWHDKAKPILDAMVTAWRDNKASVSDFVDSVKSILGSLAGIMGDLMGAAADQLGEDTDEMEDSFGSLIRTLAGVAEAIEKVFALLDKVGDYAGAMADLGGIVASGGGNKKSLRSLVGRAKAAMGFRANGGNVTRGQWLVGERGPEVVSMGRSGSVSPIASGSGGTTTYVTVNAPNYVGDKRELMAVVKAELAKDSRRGGTLIANVARQ